MHDKGKSRHSPVFIAPHALKLLLAVCLDAGTPPKFSYSQLFGTAPEATTNLERGISNAKEVLAAARRNQSQHNYVDVQILSGANGRLELRGAFVWLEATGRKEPQGIRFTGEAGNERFEALAVALPGKRGYLLEGPGLWATITTSGGGFVIQGHVDAAPNRNIAQHGRDQKSSRQVLEIRVTSRPDGSYDLLQEPVARLRLVNAGERETALYGTIDKKRFREKTLTTVAALIATRHLFE